MYKRHITKRLEEALADTPVILINGARQTGKSTLVKSIMTEYPATYYTLDNLATLAAIKSDPSGFIKQLQQPVVLDEIQKAPELFPVIKEAIDSDRKPGQFLLTGSANVLLLPNLSESLTGRMEIISLWPLSQGEITNKEEFFIDRMFAKDLSFPQFEIISREELFKRILIGGYPEVLTRKALQRQQAWFQAYLTTLLQRDVRELANIEGLTVLPRLLSLLAARSSSLLNYAELSRASGIPHTTLLRYLALLQTVFLVHTVLPWSNNFSKRLVKTPKLYLNDTGLLGYLLGIDKSRLDQDGHLVGLLLENFVVNELKKQATWNRIQVQQFHYRTQTGEEVDIVLENAAGQCVGIEIKATHLVVEKDFRALRSFAEGLKQKFIRGIILYAGEQILPFGKNLFAIPISSLWG